ncbi:MAG: hypothetical protein AAFP02_03875 [Bacteroidota bacterium]
MKKRIIQQFIGAGLLVLALAASLSVLRSMPEQLDEQAATQTEVRMEDAISVLP